MSLSETAVAIQNIVRASNSFGFALLQQLLPITPGNIVISPFSLSAALTMAANGASGTTKQAIFQSLGLSGAPIPALNAAYSSLIQMYSSTSPSCLFNVANSLWLSSKLPLDPAFSQQIAPRYFADVRNIDFTSPAAATELNLWLAQRTNGKITDAVRTIDPASAAVLVNAAYFKASWQNKFHEQQTTMGSFAQSSGPVNVLMMTQSNRFGFCPAEQFEAISLPYQGPVRMSLVVPSAADLPLDALAAGISMEIWEQIRDYLASQLQYGRVTLPKFSVRSYINLKNGLANAGMNEVFDASTADFSALTPGKPGYLSSVEHAAWLSVDEHGTDAPPSMVPVSSTAAIEFDLKVDKPFLLVIEDAQTGAFLYLAVIRNIVDLPGQRTAGGTGQVQQPQQQFAQAPAPPNGAGQPSPQLVEFDHSEATSEFPAFAEEQGAFGVHQASVQQQQALAAQQQAANMLTEPHAKPNAFGQRPGDWLDDVAEDQVETAASIPSLTSLRALGDQEAQAALPSAPAPAPQAAPAPSAPPAPQAAAQPSAPPQPATPPAPPPAPSPQAGAFQASTTDAFQQPPASPQAGAFQSGTADAFQAGAAGVFQAGTAPPPPQPASPIAEQIQPSSIDIDDSNWAPQGGWGEEEQSGADWLSPKENTKANAGLAPGTDFSSMQSASSQPAPPAPADDWASPAKPDLTAGDWASPAKPDLTAGDWASPAKPSTAGGDWASPAKPSTAGGDWASAANPSTAGGDWASAANPASDWASPSSKEPDWATPQTASPLQANPDWATPQQSAREQSSASGNWKKISSEVPNPPLLDHSLPTNKPAGGFDVPKDEGYDLAALNAIGTPGAKPTGGFSAADLDAIRAPQPSPGADDSKPSIADLNAIPTPKPSTQLPKPGASGEWSKVSSSAEGDQLVHGFTTKSDPSIAKERRDSLRSLRGGGPQMSGGRGGSMEEPPSEGFMAAIMNFFGKMFGRKD